MTRRITLLLSVAALGLLSPARRLPAAPPREVVWTYRWTAADGEGIPAAEVCDFRYGKRWAYSVEIDDGPVSTLTVSQPVLAEYAFTDAPPGVTGGRRMPFVGGAAVIALRTGTPNNTFLNWEQLRTLQSRGWQVLNHGYAHAGNHWEPGAALTPPQLRRELFWSQAIFAAELGEGWAPTHFVYPNGYMAYQPYLAEFGLRSGSRVSGTSRLNAMETGFQPSDLNRNYLDEGVWAKSNNPLEGLPAQPKQGNVLLDFTHGMDADPSSPNRLRWRARLEHLASHYGQSGDDSLWCAPTGEVINYRLARSAAKLTTERGAVRLSLPEASAGTALTLHLTGLQPGSVLQTPAGGTLYRRGTEAWVTTPQLAPAGALPPRPRLKRVYRGPLTSVKLDHPERIAGVRVLQHGKPGAGFRLKIDALTDGGKVSLADAEPGANWGAWLLYAAIPEREAPLARQVDATPEPSLKEMEIWAIQE